MNKIRNFSIIAHIDHGKSTLADRMLELTNTVEKRSMKNQVLDRMDLERERGITIKMQPVRMIYGEYILNLIDTPGHIDFSYEVSRALKAVEGSILLVDATQGVQAQTLTTLEQARASGLTIIPAISKIDSSLADVEEVEQEIVDLLDVDKSEIMRVSGKTGEGVKELLGEVIKRVPPPDIFFEKSSGCFAQPDFSQNMSGSGGFKSLVFDFQYSTHKGVVIFIRVFGGEVKKGDKLKFKIAGKAFQALEVGVFTPKEKSINSLKAGEIGYIITGIKESGTASVGDTVASSSDTEPALLGYEVARPVVWASIYPEDQDDFISLRQALSRLRLSDSAFSFEEESSGVLGRGFRAGFLGMLHLEIITERLRREFNLSLVITLPSVTYNVTYKNRLSPKGQTLSTNSQGLTLKSETIYTPSLFPESHLVESVTEPWIMAKIITPQEYVGAIIPLLYEFEAELENTETVGSSRTELTFSMPLRELMRGFFDKLKSVTSGFGSISYSISGERPADVVRLDILVADEVVSAFTKVVSRRQVEGEAEEAVEKLAKILPRQMFTLKVQAKALGRIISSKTLSGMRKDVTQHMYGGDITRKMKLREKQKKGKKKMRERGKVNIPQDIFLKMLKS